MKRIKVDIKLLPDLGICKSNSNLYYKEDTFDFKFSIIPIDGYIPYQMLFCIKDRILASSDGLLNGNSIPLIPQTFINKFCKMHGSIKYALINYNAETKEPEVRKHDNSVIVSKIKDTFTFEEVDKILQYFVEDYETYRLTNYIINKEQIITPYS